MRIEGRESKDIGWRKMHELAGRDVFEHGGRLLILTDDRDMDGDYIGVDLENGKIHHIESWETVEKVNARMSMD